MKVGRMKVGLLLPLSDDDGSGTPEWPAIRDLALQAEAGGIDSLWIYDHFFFGEGEEATGIHEAWTALTAVAVATERVEIGTLVLATSFRNPALLAKMATTLDAISNGRLILGLGCGWHEPEYTAFGYPFDHRVSRFAEALRIIGPLLREGRVTFDGTYHRAVDCRILPRGPRPAGPPIMVAARGELMLGLTAEHADLWNTAWFGTPDERLAGRIDAMRGACAAAGREPSTLGITVGVTVKESDEAWGRPGAPAALRVEPAAIAAALDAYAALGVAHVQLDVQPATPGTFAVVLDALARHRAGR
jgi:alkanesulfonate monooxygenase SsuD/methylene tetrahydromethanopterin reductase-like flavin-dependent oxidoreductase (luciferase family)